VPHLHGRRCESCDEPLAALDAERCGRCLLHPPAFRSLRAAAPYSGSARTILLAFKFRGADYLGPRLAAVAVARLLETGAEDSARFDEVTAVPATRRASRRRGFHPAEVFAGEVARRLDVPFAPRRLRKVRETVRQSGLALDRRRANVRGAFRSHGSPARRVLLVDDVATSGWTARECAAVLTEAGAEDVSVWCFARASRDDATRDELPDIGSPLRTSR
jgi:ComF family protein